MAVTLSPEQGGYGGTCRRSPRCAQGLGAYLVVGVIKFVIEFGHCLVNGSKGLNNVTKDDWLPVESLALAEALGVDELHLLQYGGFSGFASACRQAEYISICSCKNARERERERDEALFPLSGQLGHFCIVAPETGPSKRATYRAVAASPPWPSVSRPDESFGRARGNEHRRCRSCDCRNTWRQNCRAN